MKNRLLATVATIAVCCLIVCSTGCASLHLTQNFPSQGYQDLVLTPESAPINQYQAPQFHSVPSVRTLEAVYHRDGEEVSPQFGPTVLLANNSNPDFAPQPAPQTPVAQVQTASASCCNGKCRGKCKCGCKQRSRTVVSAPVQTYHVHRVRMRVRCTACR